MATFAPISYTYVPTPPRSSSIATRRKSAPKQSSIFDKLQRSKLGETALKMVRAAAAENSGGDELTIRETGTVYDQNNHDDDYDHLSIEQLLYTTLQNEGFAMEGQQSKNSAFEFGNAASERGGSLDDNGSARGDDLGGHQKDPIVLLGGDDLSASGPKVNDGGPRAGKVAEEDLLDSPQVSTNSETPAIPSNPDGWHYIDDFPETAQRLLLTGQLAGQDPSTSDEMHPYTSSSSRTSSEPLQHHIGTADHCTVRAKSEAAAFHPARPHRQPLDQLAKDRNASDEHNLVRSTLHANTEDGQKDDYDNDDAGSIRTQQEVKDNTAAALLTGKICDAHLSSKQDETSGLGYDDPTLEPSHDRIGSYGDSRRDEHDFRNTPESDEDERRIRAAKRKRTRSSSPNNGPMHKKRKHHLEQQSTRQRRPRSTSHRRPLTSCSQLAQGSRVAVVLRAKGRLLSPASSAAQTMDTEISSDCCNLGPLSSVILPTLTEITFRPHSIHCYSFTAVVREGCDGQGVSFSRLTQLIKSIGHNGTIDDFTIKPLQQNSFLLTGLSRHAPSQLSSSGGTVSTAEIGCAYRKTTPNRTQDARVIDTRAVASRSEPSSSDDDSGLGNTDLESCSDDDGCSSREGQGRSGTSKSKHSRWDDIDEQRLLAYKREDKSWDWIFQKFPTRTPAAVRTRWTIVQRRVK